MENSVFKSRYHQSGKILCYIYLFIFLPFSFKFCHYRYVPLITLFSCLVPPWYLLSVSTHLIIKTRYGVSSIK